MGIKLGGGDVGNCMIGDTQVDKLYLGDTEVWSNVTLGMFEFMADSLRITTNRTSFKVEIDGVWSTVSSNTSHAIVNTNPAKPIRIKPDGINRIMSLRINAGGSTNFTSAKIDAIYLTNAHIMCFGCIDLTHFEMSNSGHISDFSAAWSGCTGLTFFPALDTSGGTNFQYAWNGCSKLKCLSSVNTTGISAAQNMVFDNCPALLHPTVAEQASLMALPGLDWTNPGHCP